MHARAVARQALAPFQLVSIYQLSISSCIFSFERFNNIERPLDTVEQSLLGSKTACETIHVRRDRRTSRKFLPGRIYFLLVLTLINAFNSFGLLEGVRHDYRQIDSAPSWRCEMKNALLLALCFVALERQRPCPSALLPR